MRLKRRIAEIKTLYGNKCFYCENTFPLEFAHRIPTGLSGRGRGFTSRAIDILNNPNSYRLVCRDHNNFAELHE